MRPFSSRKTPFRLLVAALLSGRIESFQSLNLPSLNLHAASQTSTLSALAVSNTQSFDLSSGLISSLAVVALKARLAAQSSVECDVTAQSKGLIQGRVGPVTVKGRGWQSGLGLTCRAIEATVEVCELDKFRVVKDRKIVLQTPARGRAMIALDKTDFGNFLVHPLVKPPCNLQFMKDNVFIDPDNGTVMFDALRNDEIWRCTLRRGTKGQRRAQITVTRKSETPDNEDLDKADVEALQKHLGRELSQYFNDIVFELDGCFLTFRDLMLTDKGSAPSVMLKMGIKVTRLPSRNLAF